MKIEPSLIITYNVVTEDDKGIPYGENLLKVAFKRKDTEVYYTIMSLKSFIDNLREFGDRWGISYKWGI